MNQTWKNDKNLILGPIMAHLAQIWVPIFFFFFFCMPYLYW